MSANPYTVSFDELKWKLRHDFGLAGAVTSPRAVLVLSGLTEDVRPTWWQRFAGELRRRNRERLGTR